MSATFEAAFGRVKQLVTDFRANEKFHLSPACRCDGLPRDGVLHSHDRCPSLVGMIDFQPLAFSLQHRLFGALTSAEIKIVEGAAR